MALIDLSADLGESFGAYTLGDDAAMLEVITSANVACGFHAGDPSVMDRTVFSCVRSGVGIGAQPGFPDLRGFGRRTMDLTFDEVRTDVLYQIGALHAFAAAHGSRVTHISPHGRLGNLVVVDDRYATAVAAAITAFDPTLTVLTQPGLLADHAREQGLQVAIIGLADRAYHDDGTLVSRTDPHALITDPDTVAERAVRMVIQGIVQSVNGREVPLACDSILLHGDNSNAVEVAHLVRCALLDAGVTITGLDDVVNAKLQPTDVP